MIDNIESIESLDEVDSTLEKRFQGFCDEDIAVLSERIYNKVDEKQFLNSYQVL